MAVIQNPNFLTKLAYHGGPQLICHNCARVAGPDAQAVVTEQGIIYCQLNCYWSDKLDVGNSRVKRARRVQQKKPLRKVRSKQIVNAYDELPTAVAGQAMNSFHAVVFGERLVGHADLCNTPFG